jgi:hypothetical protein
LCGYALWTAHNRTPMGDCTKSQTLRVSPAEPGGFLLVTKLRAIVGTVSLPNQCLSEPWITSYRERSVRMTRTVFACVESSTPSISKPSLGLRLKRVIPTALTARPISPVASLVRLAVNILAITNASALLVCTSTYGLAGTPSLDPLPASSDRRGADQKYRCGQHGQKS